MKTKIGPKSKITTESLAQLRDEDELTRSTSRPNGAAGATRRSPAPAVSRWLSSSGSARALMDLAHDAILIRDPRGAIASWNAGAQATYGYKSAEVIGQVTHALLDTRFPVSRDDMERALLERGYWEGELQHRRKDGKVITVLSRHSLLRTASGRPLLVKEINRDITQERRQTGYLRLLKEVGEAVIDAETIAEALRRSLASICIHVGCSFGCAFVVNSEESAENPSTISFVGDEIRFRAVSDALERGCMQIGESTLTARALRTNQPVWTSDLSADPYYKSIPELVDARLVSAFAQPILFGANPGAVFVLFSDMPFEVDEAFLSTMSGVASDLQRCFERLAAEEAQRQLSVSLMRAQDDERRRIARELHDSAGQYLGAIGLALESARASTPNLSRQSVQKLDEVGELVERCSAELRTLSHLLHPPLLEELGLSSAANWYVQGFAERSGIKVSTRIPELPRLPQAVELTLFRILQECLTNVHRHSGSKTATVTFELSRDSIALEISDAGKGIPADILHGWYTNTRQTGVGISGMRERLNNLGSSFDIASNERGTTVRAVISLRQARANSAMFVKAERPSLASSDSGSTAK